MREIRGVSGRQRGTALVVTRRTVLLWISILTLTLAAISCTSPEDEGRRATDTEPGPVPADTTIPPSPTTGVPPTTTSDRSPSSTRLEAPSTSAEPTVFHVSPEGSDENTGSQEDPWATLTHALDELGRGETLMVHGGVYREQVRVDVTPGTPEEPVHVRAATGEEPVVEGLLWLRYLDYWTLDGLNVTWDEDENDDDEHMVKLTDGSGWVLQNSELWGARSFAALLVAGTTAGAPSGWQVVDNCIHDTVPTNDTNEDQLIYVNTGPEPTDGLIENNLLFGADNGSGIKLGGSSQNAGAAHGVTVRNNTILDTAQGILISWQSSNNVITGNYFAGTDEGYGHIRGFELEGSGNVAMGNGGDEHEPFILNDEGFAGIEDRGDNSAGLDLEIPDTPNCGFHPQVGGYGLETALAAMPGS